MKIKLTILFILLICFSKAQNVIIQEPCLDHKKGNPNREAAHAYHDIESNKLYITYMGKTKLNINTYVNMNKVDQYEFTRTEDAGLFNQVSDAILKDQTAYYLFFTNPTCAYFSVQVINLKDRSINRYPDVLKLSEDEFYLYSFSENGQFYILTSIRKTSKARLYCYDFSIGKFETNVLNFENISIDKSKKTIELWTIISNQNTISYLNPDILKYAKNASPKSEIDPKVIAKPLKFYQRNGNLVITIDGYNNTTYIMSIDLTTKKVSYDKVLFQMTDNDPVKIKTNSYLFERYILQVKVSDAALTAYVIDLENKKIIQDFSSTATDSIISFSNTLVIKNSKYKGITHSETEREIKKTKKVLRIFSEKNVFIGAIRNQDSDIEMIVGSWFIDIQGGGSMPSMGPTNMASATEHLYYFKSLINSDFKHQPNGNILESSYNQLLVRQKEIKCQSKAQTIFSLDDKYYLGYFFTDVKKNPIDYYYIEEFGSK